MNKVLKYFLFFYIAFLFFSCAKPGSPTGGPKDTDSPEVTFFSPENASTNFSDNEFEIRFNEFIELDNIQENLIVSPPFSEKPEVKLRGKKIVVVLPEKPKENTTYTFTFLNAISDITERNKIEKLVYAFSTGNIIDSLKVSGKVEDAFTAKSIQDVFVMLHKNHEDSAFRKNQPDYLTKTGKDGRFSFSFLAPGKYSIYALDDANYSFTFDQPNEKIAFIDSLIVPGVELIKDSTDSIKAYSFYPNNIVLRLFEEEKKLQFIEASNRPLSNHLQVVFKREQDSAIFWYSDSLNSENMIMKFSDKQDTLNFRLTDTILCKKDSLTLRIKYYSGVDSIGWVTDTTVFSGKSKFEDEKFNISGNILNENLSFWEKPKLTVNAGIKAIDTSLIKLYRQINDSIEKEQNLIIPKIDTTTFLIDTKFKNGEKYRILIDSAAIQDLLYRTNDSISNVFTLTSEEEYSNLLFKAQGPDTSWYCDIIKGDNLIKRERFDENGIIEFEHLVPGKYGIRIVHDKNGNGKWDTGNFLEKKYPESVFYKKDEIELRKNWTQELDWILYENDTIK